MKHKQQGLHVQIPRGYLSFCSMIQAPRSVGTPLPPWISWWKEMQEVSGLKKLQVQGWIKHYISVNCPATRRASISETKRNSSIKQDIFPEALLG